MKPSRKTATEVVTCAVFPAVIVAEIGYLIILAILGRLTLSQVGVGVAVVCVCLCLWVIGNMLIDARERRGEEKN